MVRGRVWKPSTDGFWHWQLIYWESTRHARVYSGMQREWSVAHAEMRLQHTLHSIPGLTKPDVRVNIPRFDVLGMAQPAVGPEGTRQSSRVDNPKVA